MLGRYSILFGAFTAILLATPLFRALAGHPITPTASSYEYLLANNTLYELLLIPGFEHYTPIILGISTLALLVQATKKLGLNPQARLYAHILFIITPLTITTFTTHNPGALITPLVLIAYLMTPWLAPIPLILTILISPWAGAIIAALFAARALMRRNIMQALLAIAPIALLLRIRPSLPAEKLPLFGEFGALFGYSLFILLLAGAYTIMQWRDPNASRVLSWAVLFAASAYLPELRPLILIPLAIYASIGLKALLDREWSVLFLKQASLILLICLGIFLTLSHLSTLSSQEPRASLVALTQEADEYSLSGAILTREDDAPMIRYFSQREVIPVADDNPLWDEVYMSEVGPYLAQNDVRFLLLTEQEDRSFSFLINNNQKFINLQEQEGRTLWLVLQELVPQ